MDQVDLAVIDMSGTQLRARSDKPMSASPNSGPGPLVFALANIHFVNSDGNCESCATDYPCGTIEAVAANQDERRSKSRNYRMDQA
jgi:hypothetical protein